MDARSPFNQCLALSLAGILFLNPIVSAAAQLSVDPASPGTSIDPRPREVALYDEIYQRYRALYPALKGALA